MDLIADIAKTDPQLADDLIRLLNELEIARLESRKALNVRKEVAH